MKKAVVLLAANLLFYLPGFTQFPIQYIFPMGVKGDPLGDTLLNIRTIIIKQSIKKITAWQTLPETTKAFASKTMWLNKDGNIDAITICFPKHGNSDSGLCMTDSILYDHKGRLIEFKASDAKKEVYMLSLADYISEKEMKYSTILKADADTIVGYRYLNEKGQMVRLQQIRKDGEVTNSFIFYNKDGLADSIRYDNPAASTSIFRRNEKRKTRTIEMENNIARFKWTYNFSGQCIITSIAVKNRSRRPGAAYMSETIINYYYNPDGTLSKVSDKTSDKPATTMYYSYFK